MEDQALRIKALEIALATQTGGGNRDKYPDAKGVVEAAATYLKFLTDKPDAAAQ